MIDLWFCVVVYELSVCWCVRLCYGCSFTFVVVSCLLLCSCCSSCCWLVHNTILSSLSRKELRTKLYLALQVSCVSSSPALSNRDVFKYYFQLLPADDALALGFFAIIRRYEWRHVAIIQQDENIFETVSNGNYRTIVLLV